MPDAQARVQDVMQEEVVTLQRSDRLDLADDVMRLGRIRHMPVLASGRIVGMVSNRDLLAAGLSRALEFDPEQRRAFLHSVEVSEVMSEEVVTISPEAPVREAAEKMIKQGIGCLPVVKSEGTFVGLVTETDLLRAAWVHPDVAEGEGEDEGEDQGEGEDEAEASAGLGERIEREVDALRRTRDELRVQMHLARAEARERFEALEHRWSELEGRLEQLAGEARRPMHEAREAARGLMDELKDGYRRIRDSL